MGYEFDKKKESEEKNTAKDSGERSAAGDWLPNSLVMRIMEDPAAEQEADRLSSGITSRTPGSVMKEMGGRLGADFSSVRFHSDSSSLSKGRAMGGSGYSAYKPAPLSISISGRFYSSFITLVMALSTSFMTAPL